jgi:hypothetical protein
MNRITKKNLVILGTILVVIILIIVIIELILRFSPGTAWSWETSLMGSPEPSWRSATSWPANSDKSVFEGNFRDPGGAIRQISLLPGKKVCVENGCAYRLAMVKGASGPPGSDGPPKGVLPTNDQPLYEMPAIIIDRKTSATIIIDFSVSPWIGPQDSFGIWTAPTGSTGGGIKFPSDGNYWTKL